MLLSWNEANKKFFFKRNGKILTGCCCSEVVCDGCETPPNYDWIIIDTCKCPEDLEHPSFRYTQLSNRSTVNTDDSTAYRYFLERINDCTWLSAPTLGFDCQTGSTIIRATLQDNCTLKFEVTWIPWTDDPIIPLNNPNVDCTSNTSEGGATYLDTLYDSENCAGEPCSIVPLAAYTDPPTEFSPWSFRWFFASLDLEKWHAMWASADPCYFDVQKVVDVNESISSYSANNCELPCTSCGTDGTDGTGTDGTDGTGTDGTGTDGTGTDGTGTDGTGTDGTGTDGTGTGTDWETCTGCDRITSAECGGTDSACQYMDTMFTIDGPTCGQASAGGYYAYTGSLDFSGILEYISDGNGYAEWGTGTGSGTLTYYHGYEEDNLDCENPSSSCPADPTQRLHKVGCIDCVPPFVYPSLAGWTEKTVYSNVHNVKLRVNAEVGFDIVFDIDWETTTIEYCSEEDEGAFEIAACEGGYSIYYREVVTSGTTEETVISCYDTSSPCCYGGCETLGWHYYTNYEARYKGVDQ